MTYVSVKWQMGALQLERASKQLQDLLQRDPSPSTSEVTNELRVWESVVDTLQDILCGPCDERLLSNNFYHDLSCAPTAIACPALAAAPAAALAAAPAASPAAAPAAAPTAAPASDSAAPTASSGTLAMLTKASVGRSSTGARVQAQSALPQRDIQLLLASIAELPRGPVPRKDVLHDIPS